MSMAVLMPMPTQNSNFKTNTNVKSMPMPMPMPIPTPITMLVQTSLMPVADFQTKMKFNSPSTKRHSSSYQSRHSSNRCNGQQQTPYIQSKQKKPLREPLK